MRQTFFINVLKSVDCTLFIIRSTNTSRLSIHLVPRIRIVVSYLQESEIKMGAAKRASSVENAFLSTKRAKTVGYAAPPSIVEDHDQCKSSKYPFLDDTTGFASRVSIRHFMNPEATNLYLAVRVSVFVFHNLL